MPHTSSAARSPRGTRPGAVAMSAALLAPAVLLGSPPAAQGAERDVVVSAATPVTFVADGGAAQVGVRLDVADGGPLARPVRVTWATGRGTATLGEDFDASSGEVVFPAGSGSGALLTFVVPTEESATGEVAETLSVTLDSPDARTGADPAVVIDAHDLPYLDPALPAEARVGDLLARMTPDEKAGQLTQAERAEVAGSPGVVASLGLGSVYAAPGSAPVPNTPAGWAEAVDGLQARARATRLQVPLLVAADDVHGHGNLPGATLTPHHLGLGATRDPALVAELSRLAAAELAATGVTWPVHPDRGLADVTSGDVYETFGTDPAAVAALTEAGRTGPTAALDRRVLDGLPTPEVVATAVADGADALYAPSRAARVHGALAQAVRSGTLGETVFDAAVGQVLSAKVALGLFEKRFTDRSALASVGSAEHRDLARRAVAASQVVLRDDGVLPLAAGSRLYVAGRSADDLGNQAGGWTVTWQGSSGAPTSGTTVLDGLRGYAPDLTFSEDGSAPAEGYDAAVVVVGETPYAGEYGDLGGPRWAWDTSDAGRAREPKSSVLQPGDAAVVDRVCSAVPTCVVVVVSGRPQELDASRADAVVAAWLPGTEGAGVADPLFGATPYTGTLPLPWPSPR